MLRGVANYLHFQNSTKLQVFVNQCHYDALSITTGAYNTPCWADPSTTMPTARCSVLTSAGIDGIRLTFSPSCLMQAADDATLDARIGLLTDGLTYFYGKGLKVVLCAFFTTNGDSLGYTTTQAISGGVDGLNWSRFSYCMGRLAKAIEALRKPDWFMLEFANQMPSTSQITGAYPTYIQKVWNVCRQYAPRTTLGIQGSCAGVYDGSSTGTSASGGLKQFTLANFDKNTILCGQGYDVQGLFCFQGESGELGQLNGLTWPASSHPGGLAAAKASWDAALDAALVATTITQQQHDDRSTDLVNGSAHAWCLTKYFNNFGGKSGLTASLAERAQIVTDMIDAQSGWSRKQFAMVEVGVHYLYGNKAPSASWLQFVTDIKDVHTAAGSNFISFFNTGSSTNDTYTSNTEPYLVQSGASPYAMATGFLTALGL